MSRGFDKEAINSQLLFGLTLEEMIGGNLAVIHDRAKPHHTCTLHGATIGWGSLASGIPYLDLTAITPDWVDCPAADTADLNFIAGDFSLIAWINIDSLAIFRQVLMRGSSANAAADGGWDFYIRDTGALRIATWQAWGVEQTSATPAAVITTGIWYLIGATRSGASIRLYVNGLDLTSIIGVHVNPASVNLKLHIGIDNVEVNNPLDGKLALPRIWGRKLSAEEMHEIWDRERVLFNV